MSATTSFNMRVCLVALLLLHTAVAFSHSFTPEPTVTIHKASGDVVGHGKAVVKASSHAHVHAHGDDHSGHEHSTGSFVAMAGAATAYGKCPVCLMDVTDQDNGVVYKYGQTVYACSESCANKLKSLGSEQYVASYTGAKVSNPDGKICPICDMDPDQMLPVEFKGGQELLACSVDHQKLIGQTPSAYVSTGEEPPMSMMMQMYFTTGMENYVLFKGWYTDTPFKYFCSVVGTMIAAVLHQFLVRLRMHLASKPKQDGYVRMESRFVTIGFWLTKTTLAVVYFFTVCLSYLLMLVAMTYNVGLFLAVAAGLAVGFFVFSTEGGSLVTWGGGDSPADPKEDAFGCCGESGGFTEEKSNAGVPLRSTPAVQRKYNGEQV